MWLMLCFMWPAPWDPELCPSAIRSIQCTKHVPYLFLQFTKRHLHRTELTFAASGLGLLKAKKKRKKKHHPHTVFNYIAPCFLRRPVFIVIPIALANVFPRFVTLGWSQYWAVPHCIEFARPEGVYVVDVIHFEPFGC